LKSDDVRDYIEKEHDISKRILNNLLKSNEKIPSKSIFPEYDLNQLYCTSLEPYSKIWEMLPFRKKLLVHINVDLSDAHQFNEWYGVSVEQLVQLEKNKKIEIMINLPADYMDLPSYLDVMLERRFPSSARFKSLTEQLVGEEIRKSIDEKISMLAKRLPMSVDGLGKIGKESERRVFRTTRAACYQLLCLGYDKEVDDVIRTAFINPELARKLLDSYRLFLAGPYFYSLDGIHQVSGNAVIQNDIRGNLHVMNENKIFPSEVARILVDTLALVRPHNLDHAMDIYPDYEEAVNALSVLERYVKKNETIKEISDMTLEIKRIFHETLLGIENKKTTIEKIIEILCIGGATATGFAIGGMGGILLGPVFSAIGNRYVSHKISKKAAMGRSGGLISIFDFKKNVDNWHNSFRSSLHDQKL
jgi:hypothetical protein